MTEDIAGLASQSGGLITLVEGSSFCISTPGGQIQPGSMQGLFHRDTRVLSSWSVRVEDHDVEPLAAGTPQPNHAIFLGRIRPRREDGESKLLIRRDRYVGAGIREDISVLNFAETPMDLTMEIRADADFAGLFAVKEGRVGDHHPRRATIGTEALDLEASDESPYGVHIHSDDASYGPGTLLFKIAVPPRGQWHTHVQVLPTIDGQTVDPTYPLGESIDQSAPSIRQRAWADQAPVVWGADDALLRTLVRSGRDLGSLRIFEPDHPDEPAIAAGAPWFMALFGRDALLTSYMSLPVDQQLALGTLRTLARHQGSSEDPASEEQPGRIVHEMRFGEDVSLVPDSGSLYYGTIDATPLFVMVLGELTRWGLAEETLRDLLPHADRALAWIENYGDRDGDGFVEYLRLTKHGLRNQGWKDSWDGINFADGRIAEPPIALCEVQGYVYAAYRARAEIARRLGDAATATDMDGRAKTLKDHFNEAYWLPDRGWYAVGLDRDKRPIDSLTSNIGHCLWTGIIDEKNAQQVADHLLSAQMFTGWGVRTLASDMGAYNPISYHNGSVWPHDNALVATGLMRYGFVDQAQKVAEAVLGAAEAFEGRLPELFSGLDRDQFPTPVSYPGSCRPQAWAAAAPVQLIRTLLRFDPDLPHDVVWVDPALPTSIPKLHITNAPMGKYRISLACGAHHADVSGLGPDVRVVTGGDGR